MTGRRPLTWETLGYLLLAFALAVGLAVMAGCRTGATAYEVRNAELESALFDLQAQKITLEQYRERQEAAERKLEARLEREEQEREAAIEWWVEVAMWGGAAGVALATGSATGLTNMMRNRARKQRGEPTGKPETKERT